MIWTGKRSRKVKWFCVNRSGAGCGGIRYETRLLLFPVLVKRNFDPRFFRWRGSGVCNLYQQSFHCGRDCAPRAYERYGIRSAPVSDRSRLRYPLSLYLSLLYLPEVADTGAPCIAFLFEPGFISGYYGGNNSVIDTFI